MPEHASCPLAPNMTDVYRQLGSLAKDAEHRAAGQEEIKEALGEIRRRLHDIANTLTPVPTLVQRVLTLEEAQEEREKDEARQAGVRKGVGIGLAFGGGTIGAGLTKFVEWFFGGPLP